MEQSIYYYVGRQYVLRPQQNLDASKQQKKLFSTIWVQLFLFSEACTYAPTYDDFFFLIFFSTKQGWHCLKAKKEKEAFSFSFSFF